MEKNLMYALRAFFRETITEVVHDEFEKINLTLLSKPKEESEQEIMFVPQAAKFLNRAVATIYALVQKNELPHYRRGRQLLFKRSELLAWINEGKQEGGLSYE